MNAHHPTPSASLCYTAPPPRPAPLVWWGGVCVWHEEIHLRQEEVRAQVVRGSSLLDPEGMAALFWMAAALGAELVLKGERHTSTHFTGSTLARNFGSTACENEDTTCSGSCDGTGEPEATTFCCWKHGYANAGCPWMNIEPYPAHVLLVRTPYSWLASMYADPYEYLGCDGNGCGCDGAAALSDCSCGAEASCGNFSNFLRSQFAYQPYETYFYSEITDTAATPVDLWNAKTLNATTFSSPAVRVSHLQMLNYSTMTRQLEPLLSMGYSLTDEANASYAQAGLLMYPDFFHGEETQEDMWSNDFSYDDFLESELYETTNGWLELYTQEDLDFVNSRLDHTLMDAWNIQLVSSVTDNQTGIPLRKGIHRAARRAGSVQAAMTEPDAAGGAGSAWDNAERRAWHRRRLTLLK